MRMYHGNHNSTAALHPGLCLTDDDDAARDYGRNGWIHAMDIDLTGLAIISAEGYDHDANWAPGDDSDDQGADILVFTDETDDARRHQTYRLMTAAALARVTPAGSERANED